MGHTLLCSCPSPIYQNYYIRILYTIATKLIYSYVALYPCFLEGSTDSNKAANGTGGLRQLHIGCAGRGRCRVALSICWLGFWSRRNFISRGWRASASERRKVLFLPIAWPMGNHWLRVTVIREATSKSKIPWIDTTTFFFLSSGLVISNSKLRTGFYQRSRADG